MNRRNDHLIKRDASEIPGRPNLFDGVASRDALANSFALRRLSKLQNVRAIVIPAPPPVIEVEEDEEKELTDRERQRDAMEKQAIKLMEIFKANSEETSLPGKVLSQGMKIKIKAVASYLSSAIKQGRIIKLRRSQNPQRPSEIVAHYYLPTTREEISDE